jgi:hypothetical protein
MQRVHTSKNFSASLMAKYGKNATVRSSVVERLATSSARLKDNFGTGALVILGAGA